MCAGMYADMQSGVITAVAAFHRSAPLDAQFLFISENGHVFTQWDTDINPAGTGAAFIYF
jgi:hypothetical protein